ncbi:MAG: c-type cytochrome, partial [Planctomycetota bacterium]
MARLHCLLLLVTAAGLAALGCGPPPPPDGAALYAEHCAACHGTEGGGDGPLAVSFEPIPRDFTTGRFAYRSTG